MKNKFNSRRWLASAMVTAGLAVAGFVGLRAATVGENPPATIKTAPRSEAAARRGYSAMIKKVVPAVVNISSSKVVGPNTSSRRGPRGDNNQTPRFRQRGDNQGNSQDLPGLDPFFRQFFGDGFQQQFNVPQERREKS